MAGKEHSQDFTEARTESSTDARARHKRARKRWEKTKIPYWQQVSLPESPLPEFPLPEGTTFEQQYPQAAKAIKAAISQLEERGTRFDKAMNDLVNAALNAKEFMPGDTQLAFVKNSLVQLYGEREDITLLEAYVTKIGLRPQTQRENAGDNPAHEDVDLTTVSLKDLKGEITRREKEKESDEGPDSHRARYVQGQGTDYIAYFLKTWGDLLDLDKDGMIKPDTKPIDKLRVRNRDSRLMKLVEAWISKRITNGEDLGPLQNIKFVVREEKSNNRTLKFARRGITTPALDHK